MLGRVRVRVKLRVRTRVRFGLGLGFGIELGPPTELGLGLGLALGLPISCSSLCCTFGTSESHSTARESSPTPISEEEKLELAARKKVVSPITTSSIQPYSEGR